MNSTFKTILVSSVLFLAVAWLGYHSHLQAITALEEQTQNELRIIGSENNRLVLENAGKDSQIAGLQESITELESQLEAARITSTANTSSPNPDDTAVSALPTPGEEVDVNEIYQHLTSSDKSELYNLLTQERQRQPENRLLMAHMTLNNVYGEFLNSLDLTEDERVKLSDYMKIFIADQQELAQQLADGEITRQQFMDMNRDYSMLDHLSAYLPPDELEKFRLYQETLMARQRSRQTDMLSNNMTTIVPGISEGTSRIAAEAISKEMLSMSQMGGASGVELMTEVYERAEKTLRETLDDDEMAQVREYMEIQKRLIQNAQNPEF